MGAVKSSLVRITDSEYAKRIADGIPLQTSYNSWAWTEREGAITLVVTYYSESETGTLNLKIPIPHSRGKNVSHSYIGNSNDVARVARSLVSALDMISRRF